MTSETSNLHVSKNLNISRTKQDIEKLKTPLRLVWKCCSVISFLYVCMVNTIYLLSFVETPRKFIIAIINLRGVSTKLNKYKCCSVVFKIGSKIFSLQWLFNVTVI